MDKHSFREIWVSLAGARRRHQREWEHTLYTVQAIQNIMAKRPEPLDTLYRKAFKVDRVRKPMTHDQIKAAFAAVSVPAHGVS